MKKKILIGIGVLVVLVIVAVVVVLMNIDGIIKSTVQTQATKSLDLKTSLDSANLSLLGGTLALKDLQIASPEGFKAPQMFTLGGVNLAVDYGQLRSDPIHVKAVNIQGPVLTLEHANGKLNIKEVMDHLSSGTAAPTPAPTPTDGKTDAAVPMRLIVDQLDLAGATVNIRPGVDLPIKGLKDEYKITIPAISMKNIGSGEGAQNGIAIKELVMKVASAMADKALDSDQVPPELKALLTGDMTAMKAQLEQEVRKQLGGLTKKLPGDLGKTLSNPDEVAKDPGKAISEGIGGLMNNKKDDKKDDKKKKP